MTSGQKNVPDHHFQLHPIWSRSLNGIWKFSPKAPADFAKIEPTQPWSDIEVPGQWRNQGHDLPKEQATAYLRTFTVPKQWKERLIKLRFDAVFSDCEVFLNGQSVGSHVGGFTPFELDITKAVKEGSNTLALRVTSWSLSDLMASASKYACHNLGGISRDVTLFSVPQKHLKDIIIRTDMDDQFQDATLKLSLELSQKADAKLRLIDSEQEVVFSETHTLSSGINQLEVPVKQPKHWTSETPYLYTLEVNIDGSITQHPVGFREITVTQSGILVNGKPVTLRGVNRHEAHPLRGRSMPEGQWEEDVLLFRDANVNLIRTCHYPPGLQLGTASDQHGMWIEVEGPFCWEKGPNNPDHRALTIQQLAEMVKAWRNHPSILYWSIANESAWGQNFIMASKVMRELDPTRPQTFNWISQDLNRADEPECELANIHYPGFKSTKFAEEYKVRPLLFGEYAHLNAYNRRELITDPGLRDQWGYPFAEMWETMWQAPNIIGGAIWSGIDDTFFIDENLTLGYGAWGPIDPWRRPKPEYWHMKKVYSPIHLINRHDPVISESSLTLDVENRGDFLNFNQLTFTWSHNNATGTISPNIDPRAKGKIVVAPPHGISSGAPVTLTVTHPLGYTLDHFVFPTRQGDKANSLTKSEKPRLQATADQFTVTQGESSYQISRKTGAFTASVNSELVIQHGPHLVLTPLSDEGNTQMQGETKRFEPLYKVGSQYKNEPPVAQSVDGSITITVPCSYEEAQGNYTYTFSEGAPVRLSYDFVMKSHINPRQTGIAFDLPATFNQLDWQRKGQWTAYPDDHIGRLRGTARLHYPKGTDALEIGPRSQPSTPWSHDNHASGSNDFRSTKHNIRSACLKSSTGALQVSAGQDGTHFQALAEKDTVRAFIFNYSNAGNERFLRRLTAKNDKPLSVGDQLTGVVEFIILESALAF